MDVADDSEQTRFLESQRDTLGDAARQAYTLGIADCMDAANRLLESEEEGRERMEKCEARLKGAKKLAEESDRAAERARKDGLTGSFVSESLIKSERSQQIFREFESKFGKPGEELVRSMLANGASVEELRDVLRAKLGEEKTDELLRDPESLKFLVNLSGKSKGKAAVSKGPGLRDKVRSAMAEQVEGGPGSEVSAKATKRERLITPEDLTPLRDDPLFVEAPEEELTLFQVIKRKYREKWEMLVPYRAHR